MKPGTSIMQALRQGRKQVLDCLPSAWKQRIASRITPYVLELGGDSARLSRDGQLLDEIRALETGLDAGMVARLKSREHPLLLLLPDAWVLSRTVVLPQAAAENLRQVLGFELDRLTPFTADQVYFDYRLMPRENQGDLIEVAVALVPRRRVDDWLDLLQGVGISVDTMSAPALWEDANLLPPERRARPDLKRLTLRALPGVLVLILLMAALALPLWQKRQLALSLQQQENSLRARASKVIKIRETLDKELKAVKDVHAQWQSAPPVLDVLQVLTNLLPDDTALQRMEIKGNELIINGTSGQASSLIGLLQKAPGFDNPHFLSPVTQQRGKELFNLSATINMPFPRETGVGSEIANPAAQSGQQGAVKEKRAVSVRKETPPAPQKGKLAANATPKRTTGGSNKANQPPRNTMASSPPASEVMPEVIRYSGENRTKPVTRIQGSSNTAPPSAGHMVSGAGG